MKRLRDTSYFWWRVYYANHRFGSRRFLLFFHLLFGRIFCIDIRHVPSSDVYSLLKIFYHVRPRKISSPAPDLHAAACTCMTILVPRLSYSRRQILRYGDAGGQGTSTDTSRCAAGTTRGVRSREREDGEAAAALLRLPRDEKGQGRMRGGKRGGELCRSDRSSQGVPQKAWVQSLGPCNCILLSASIYITTVIL